MNRITPRRVVRWLLPLTLLFVAGQVSAQEAQEPDNDYRVVVGSFLSEQNAEELIRMLSEIGYDAETSTAEVSGRTFHRVYLAERHITLDEARLTLSHINRNPAIHSRLGTDFWILNLSSTEARRSDSRRAGHTEPLPASAPDTETRRDAAEAFGSETNEDIPIGPETPHSVRVASYRSRPDAERALREPALQDIDPFLLRTYEPQDGMRLNLMVGAFERDTRANSLVERLDEQGVGDPELVAWDQVEEAASAYDELSVEERTEYIPPEPAWGTIPPEVRSMLESDIIPRGYRVREITIVNQDDPATLPDSPFFELYAPHPAAGWSVEVSLEPLLGGDLLSIQGFTYRDSIQSDWPSGDDLPIDEDALEARNWNRSDSIVPGFFGSTEDSTLWHGIDGGKAHAWFIGSEDAEALERLLDGERLRPLVNSETIVKTLSLLPQERDVSLWAYQFDRVGEDYVTQKNNAAWARAMQGNWRATTVVETAEEPFFVSAFEVNLRREARRVYDMFLDSHETRLERVSDSVEDRILEVNGKTAVYVHEGAGRREFAELSFQQGSFVMALNARLEGNFDLESLVSWAQRLRIWEDDI